MVATVQRNYKWKKRLRYRVTKPSLFNSFIARFLHSRKFQPYRYCDQRINSHVRTNLFDISFFRFALSYTTTFLYTSWNGFAVCSLISTLVGPEIKRRWCHEACLVSRNVRRIFDPGIFLLFCCFPRASVSFSWPCLTSTTNGRCLASPASERELRFTCDQAVFDGNTGPRSLNIFLGMRD